MCTFDASRTYLCVWYCNSGACTDPEVRMHHQPSSCMIRNRCADGNLTPHHNHQQYATVCILYMLTDHFFCFIFYRLPLTRPSREQRPSTARESNTLPGGRPFSSKLRLSRTRISRPISARSTGVFSESAVSSCSRTTTPAEAMLLFRDSIRPLLASVMRQGSETQHPCGIKPVSVCALTPTAKFRFRNKLI